MTPTDTLIQQLVDTIKSTKDFAAEQLPDVANQIILRGWMGAIMGLVITSILLVTLLLLGRHFYKKYKENDDYAPGFIICFVCAALSLIPLIHFMYDAFCLYYTPKLVVVKELMKMIHG